MEQYEAGNREELTALVERGNEIRGAVRKVREAGDCAMIYGDLCRSEEEVRSSGSGGKGGDRFGGANKKSTKKSSFGSSDFRTPTKNKGGADGSSGPLLSEMENGDRLDDWSDDAMEGCAGKFVCTMRRVGLGLAVTIYAHCMYSF